MTKPLRTTFVIADARHARWVARDDATHDFKTVRRLEAHGHAAHAYSGAVVEGATGHRHGVREPRAAAHHEAEAFAAKVAEALKDGEGRLVLVAPSRMLSALQDALPAAASARLAGALAKDLSKVADHDLARWLAPLEL